MSNVSAHSARIRRLWKPTLITGAGGTGIAIWLEEILAFAADMLGVILLVILGSLICLFDHLVFRSRTCRREDVQITDKGENH